MRRLAISLCFGLGVFALDAGCGSTGSARFVFDAEAAGSTPAAFTNALGWNVTLTKATFTVGPLYLNVVAPLRSASYLGIRPVYADDSHLPAGRIVGEVLGQVTVDTLSPAFVPFPIQGTMTQEEVRTAEVWLWPAPGVAPETTKIDTVAADLAGTATRGSDRVKFRGQIIINDAWASDAQPGEHSAQPISEIRKVRGIPAEFFPEESGHLELRIDASKLFTGADFSSIEDNPTDADGTKILVQSKSGAHLTDQVMKNAFEGLRAATGTYDVRWTASP